MKSTAIIRYGLLNKFAMQIHGVLIAFAFLSATTTPAQSQTIDIKPRWQVGKKYTQTSKTEEISTIEIGNQKMEQKVGMTIESTLAIRLHENGKFKRVTMKYDRIAIAMSMAGQEIKCDSAKAGDAESDPLGAGKLVGILIGKEVKMVLDDKDEVIEVGNLDALLKQMAAADPKASMFGELFNKDAMKNMIRQNSLLGAPGKPVKAGDAWPFTYSVSMEPAGKVSIAGNYTMKGQSVRAGAKCAELAISGKIGIEAAPTGATPGPGSAGTLSGSVWFDPALGICRDSETTRQMNLKVKNPVKPDEPMEVPMKQVVKQTITKVENL